MNELCCVQYIWMMHLMLVVGTVFYLSEWQHCFCSANDSYLP